MSAEDSEELPVGWAWAKLGELGRWAGGGTPTTSVAEYWDNGTIPWISAKDMKADYLGASQDSITEMGREAARLTLLPSGSVLMVVRGMILARTFPVAVTTAPATINQDLRALVPSPVVEPAFLLRALQLIAREVVQATGEATHGTRRLDSDMMKGWPIPLPPLAEQRRIVEAIERLLEKVESTRERLKRVPQTLRRFRQAVLAAGCLGRLTSDWRREPGNTEPVNDWLDSLGIMPSSSFLEEQLPEVPENWNWRACSDLSEQGRALTYGVIKLGPPIDRGVPCLRSSDVRPLFIDREGIKRISPAIAAAYGRTLLQGGELLVTVRGTLGGVAVVPGDLAGANVSREVAVVPLRREVEANFICFWVASTWSKAWLGEQARGAAYTGINIADLKRLPIAIPPYHEQCEIVRRISELLTLADTIEQQATAALQRVELLTQSALAKAFRGDLVPTEAELARREGRSYELASELLARLKVSVNGEVKRSRAKKTSKRSSASGDELLKFMEG